MYMENNFTHRDIDDKFQEWIFLYGALARLQRYIRRLRTHRIY
jgi:hypothetical protein